MRYALDANVWLYATTSAAFAEQVERLGLGPLGLPAVVASELLRRALTLHAMEVADEIVDRWRHALLAPTAGDWLAAAAALREMRRRYRHDAVGLARLQNDALIAVSCARAGWTVVTTNQADFDRLVAVLGARAPKLVFLQAPG
jgi:predicted nucleic acid-binding protein